MTPVFGEGGPSRNASVFGQEEENQVEGRSKFSNTEGYWYRKNKKQQQMQQQQVDSLIYWTRHLSAVIGSVYHGAFGPSWYGFTQPYFGANEVQNMSFPNGAYNSIGWNGHTVDATLSSNEWATGPEQPFGERRSQIEEVRVWSHNPYATPTILNNDKEDLCTDNVEEEGEPMEEISGIHTVAEATSQRDVSESLRNEYENETKPTLSSEPTQSTIEGVSIRDVGDHTLNQRTSGLRSRSPPPSGRTMHQSGSTLSPATMSPASPSSAHDLLEKLQPLGRNLQDQEKEFYLGSQQRGGDRLAEGHEGVANRSVQTLEIRGTEGRYGGRNSPRASPATPPSTDHAVVDQRISEVDPETVHRSLDQKRLARCSDGHNLPNRSRQPSPRYYGQASESDRLVPTIDNSLCIRSEACTAPGDRPCDSTFVTVSTPNASQVHSTQVNEFDDDCDNNLTKIGEIIAALPWPDEPVLPVHDKSHRISTRRGTKIPKTVEEKAAPLGAKATNTFKLEWFTSRMLPRVYRRFDQLLRESFPKSQSGPPSQPGHSQFSHHDSDDLIEKGIAAIVEEKDKKRIKGYGTPFTVLEEKYSIDPVQEGFGDVLHSGKDIGPLAVRWLKTLKRRFILWPKSLNARLSSYVPDVPLPWVITLLNLAEEEYGGCRDLQSAFFQFELTEEQTYCLCFVDDLGRTLKLLRLPMGLRTSPEILQILLSVLVGHPNYCVPTSVFRDKSIYSKVIVWLDNVIVAGKESTVKEFLSFFDERAAEARATLNQNESRDGVKLEALGIMFDFQNHSVSLKESFLGKVSRQVAMGLNNLSVAELESLIGRLVYGASVLGIPLWRYWFALKISRRRFNSRSGSSPADLPRCAISQLEDWISYIFRNEPRKPPASRDVSFHLFCDASKDGWGAVLIGTSSIHPLIVGGKWATRPDNINGAEARALVLAVNAFRKWFTPNTSVEVHIDNTSVYSNVKSLSSASFAVACELARLNLPKNVQWEFSYVKSLDNLADSASRGRMDVRDIYERHGLKYLRQGGSG